MLRGQKVGLRARVETDIPILHAELYDDVAVHSRSDSRPWRPIAAGSSASPFAISEPNDKVSVFSVVTLSDGELVGDAVLWNIDSHNRAAHIGISLRPASRGTGLAADTVGVLCHYGFVVRGLHRLQIETLAENAAMIATARRVGFTHEGTLRASDWVTGAFLDQVIYGLLADDYTPPPSP
jgi:RimJ/RimL family protein N-acetyltransferase